MKRTKRGSMGCRRVVPLFASIVALAGWLSSGPVRAATPAADYSSQVTVTASNQRSVADRRTNTITSDADVTLKNNGAVAISAPLWAVIQFSSAGVGAPTQSGTWTGPAGSWSPARPYCDLSGAIGQGLLPGAKVTFHVKFVCPSTVRYTYKVLTYGAATPTQNHSPTANAGGPYTGNVGQAISFSGSGNDPDHDTLTYSWAFGDGGTANVATPTHVYGTGGPFVATLTVSDGKGGTGSSTATVTVNRPPTATAGGPYTGNVGQAISFSGSGSDPDQDTLSYSWAFGDGGTANVAAPTHVYMTGGPFTATLTVSDGKGGTGSSTAAVAVNRPPTANAGGPYAGNVGQGIHFNGSGDDPDHDALTYFWVFGDGGTADVAAPMHVYMTGGPFTATLTVTDPQGLTGSSTAAVAVNRPPTANAGGPYAGNVGQAIRFSGSGDDPDHDALTYSWAFGDGGTANVAAPTHVYATDGSFAAVLTVTDPKGLTAASQATVTVTAAGNQPPTAEPGPNRTVALSYVRAAASVQLDGTKSTDIDGTVVGYAWTAGSGGPDPADEAKPTVSLAAGTYTFTLVVTDDKGAASAPKSVVITVVKEAVQLPAVTVDTPPPYQVAAGGSTPLALAVSAASPDGRPVSLTASPLLASATFQAVPGPLASGTYVFQPGFVPSGTYLVTFTARDTYGLTTSTTVPIDVGATNRPPVLTVQDTATVVAGGVLSIPVAASDPDGDILTLTATGLPENAVFVPSSGGITFTPARTQTGTYDITVRASDGQSATAGQVAVTVTPPESGGGGSGGPGALVLTVDPVESPSFLTAQRLTGTVNSAAEPRPAQKSTLITGMSPTTGEQGSTVIVTLTGDVGSYATNFAAGTSAASFGSGITVKSLAVTGPSQAAATIAIDPAAVVGARSVRVVTGSETAVSVNAFTVLSGKTTVTGRLVEPGTGVPIAGATVVIQGTTARATTGLDGTFTLQGVPPGPQDLLVTALNHQSVLVRISPQIGVPVVVEDLELTPTVFDPATAPAASLGSVVGRGLGTFSFTGDPEEGKQLIRDTLFAVGGKRYGLIDEYGNQQNPNVEGNGIASLKPNGLTAMVGRWHRGETMPLGVILQGMVLAFDWENSNPPSLFRLLKSLQGQVNRAWSDPTDPANALLVAMFNRGRSVSPAPPTLTQDTPLNAVQSYLFSVTVFGYVSSQVLYYQDLPDEGLGALGRNEPSDRSVLLAWNEWTRDLGVASDVPPPRALLLAQVADTRPVAYAGPTQTIPVSKDTGSIPVTLDGRTSYAKNGRTLVLYKWVRTSSADPDPADEMSPTIELMPKDQGTLIGRKHTFRLVVQDSEGEWSNPSEVLIVLDGPCRIIDAGDPSLVPWCEVFESVGTSQIVSLTSSVTIDPYLESLKTAISPTLVEDAATKATAVKRWTDYLELLDFTDQQYLSKVRAEDFVSSFEDSKKAAATIGKVTQFTSAAAGIMTDVVGSIVGQVANSLFKDLIINDLIKNFVESARPNAPYVDSAVLVPPEQGGTQTVQVTFRPAQDEVGTAANGSSWKYYYAVYRQSRGVPGFGTLITVLPSYRFNAQLADVEDDEVGRAAMRYALQKSGREMRLRFVDTDPAPGTNTYRLVTRVMRGHTIPNKPYIDPIVKAGFDFLVEKSTGASGKILVDGMFTCLDAMEAILTGVIYQWSEYSDPAMVYVGTAAESRFPRIDLAVAERTGEIFVSLPDTSKIFKWTTEGLKVRVDAGFKTPYQTGLASDAYGNLYTDNRASDLQFGGRLFRFSALDNSRVLVGSTNYYSMLLQYARSTDVKGLTYALDGKDQVLFVADGMEQRINRLDLYDGAIVDRNVSQGYVSSTPETQLFFQDTTRLFWDPTYRTLFFTQGNEILKAPKGGPLERAFLPDANPFAGAWLTGIDGDENGLYVADSISGKVTLIPHWYLTTRGFGLPEDYLKRYTVARFTGPLDIKVLGARRQLVAVDAAGVRIAGFGLSGRIWDGQYNEPLAGASLLLDDVLAGQTDAQGYFVLNNIATSGPVRLTVESLDGRVHRLSDRSGTSGQTVFVNPRGQTVLEDDLLFDPPPVPRPQDVDANTQNVQVDPSPFPATSEEVTLTADDLGTTVQTHFILPKQRLVPSEALRNQVLPNLPAPPEPPPLVVTRTLGDDDVPVLGEGAQKQGPARDLAASRIRILTPMSGLKIPATAQQAAVSRAVEGVVLLPKNTTAALEGRGTLRVGDTERSIDLRRVAATETDQTAAARFQTTVDLDKGLSAKAFLAAMDVPVEAGVAKAALAHGMPDIVVGPYGAPAGGAPEPAAADQARASSNQTAALGDTAAMDNTAAAAGSAGWDAPAAPARYAAVDEGVGFTGFALQKAAVGERPAPLAGARVYVYPSDPTITTTEQAKAAAAASAVTDEAGFYQVLLPLAALADVQGRAPVPGDLGSMTPKSFKVMVDLDVRELRAAP